MNRIDKRFKSLRAAGRKGVIAYLTAGDPDLAATEDLVMEMALSGVAMVELGVPFSDPVADGPVIQAASARALKKGVTLNDVLNLAAKLRSKTDIPLLIMSYYNPVLSYGIDRFVEDARKSGIDGIIVPDLPLEESETLSRVLTNAGIHFINLLSPTSSTERIRATTQQAGGFIYCVSVTGVTGAREDIPASGRELLKRVRSYTDLPLALGFGISRPQQVASLGDEGDAVIIGSAIVRLVEEGGGKKEITERVKSYLEAFK